MMMPSVRKRWRMRNERKCICESETNKKQKNKITLVIGDLLF